MLDTLIKPFQKFPMWLRHPNETKTRLRPLVVNNEEHLKEYLSKGYVAPEIDEAAFADAQIQIHLAKQMIAIMTGGQRALEFFTRMEYDHGQLKTELNELYAYPAALTRHLDHFEIRMRMYFDRQRRLMKKHELMVKKATKARAKPARAKKAAKK
jgi:hypothetical protein